MLYRQARQRLSQLFQPAASDRCIEEPQLLQARQSFEVRQAGVRDLGAVEIEMVKVCQPVQVGQPSVADNCFVQVERLELGQPLQVHQTRV